MTSAPPPDISMRSPGRMPVRYPLALPAGRSSTNHPDLLSTCRGEVDCDRLPGTLAGNRGGHGGGVVHHQQIARAQVVTEVDESDVADTARAGDQQFDRIPGHTMRLRRLGGVGARRPVEPRVRTVRESHGSAPDNKSAARYRPEAGRVSMSRSNAGTTDSGSARSEMSSPGNAAWCISVRMSPGSKTYTGRAEASAASTADSWSSAAFDEPYPPHPGYGSTAASELRLTIAPRYR